VKSPSQMAWSGKRREGRGGAVDQAQDTAEELAIKLRMLREERSIR